MSSSDSGGRDQLIRVLVVDDQELIREGIASLLSLQEGMEVVGTAADGREAVDRAVELGPHVILMDVRMPPWTGCKPLRRLGKRVPQCRVVMLTTFEDERYVVEALRDGQEPRLEGARAARPARPHPSRPLRPRSRLDLMIR